MIGLRLRLNRTVSCGRAIPALRSRARAAISPPAKFPSGRVETGGCEPVRRTSPADRSMALTDRRSANASLSCLTALPPCGRPEANLQYRNRLMILINKQSFFSRPHRLSLAARDRDMSAPTVDQHWSESRADRNRIGHPIPNIAITPDDGKRLNKFDKGTEQGQP